MNKNKFKFDKCSNHYFSDCQNSPEIINENKEMCLKCYVEETYRELEFAIKYGKRKSAFKLIKNNAFDK